MNDEPTLPTLEDVARLAGVSTATVSRALNSPDKVVEHTRTRVMEVVEQLGYSPNFGAKAMAAKRTKTIGAVIPTMENAIFATGLQAFQEELRKQGYHLLVASTSYKSEIEDEQVRELIARGAEAILLIGHDREDSTIEYLQQRGLPTLVSWTFETNTAFPSVGFDNYSAMKTMAEKVLSFGHKKIAVISANSAENDRARSRIQAIKDVLANIELAPTDIIEIDYSISAGGGAFETIMAQPIKPTAIMCGNDVLAVGAVKRAKELGYKVPEDISITGFDDIEIATVIEPQLTTIAVPHQIMGRQAAKTIIQMVDQSPAIDSICLETKIKMRGTLDSVKTKST